eukprot:CAMPEP_0178403386 /NCGR_PEP_ID=MMETSP0689_2-20121128/17340_1 /TAXON_ID=160604 /ORGANISM="Amphidinium massartii, Strain CS-259" /LENGTH=685 /DNA_ID=CAMNT_0020024335 /DNA_START=173 /DNA_END=2230 /DNA_ORIENTATION=+
MKCLAAAVAVFFFLARQVESASSSVTPIQKVLQLLDDMLAKGVAAKKEEEVKFSAFSQWCQDQTRIKNDEIAKGTSEIESLTASIEQNDATIKKLGARIMEVEEDVGRWDKDQASATDVRTKEKADFVATVADYSESIQAIAQALQVLKKQAYNRAQSEDVAEALIQVRDLHRTPAKAKAALAAFLQEAIPNEDFLLREAPEAYGYEFQSQGVVQMLQKLADEFDKKKMEIEEEELKAEHAYKLIMQQLTDNVENGKHELGRKNAAQAKEKGLKADNEGELAQVTSDRAEDQKYLDETTALCTQKKTDFDSRQALRAEEIESLKKAIEIISSKAVEGSGEEYLPQLVQLSANKRGSALALTQLRVQAQSPQQARMVAMLQDRAQRLGSKLLAQVAEEAVADPFGKVKKLIKDLISKLMQEATAEQEHKGWCDSELAANKINKEARTAEVEQLTEEIDGLTADIQQLTSDIEKLSKEIAELEAAMAEATAEREDSKAINMKTIADAKLAQTAVQEAIAVLKDYYTKSVEATAFTQQTQAQTPAEDAPETFDKPYKGLFPEGGNIVDFLEVILTDFTRLESETAATEEQEQSEYEKFMFESKKDKALKENEKGHKANTKTDKESALQTAKEDLKMSQEALDKANAYYEKLKPSCVDSGINYEDRVRRREEEIQSLEEALKILAGESI